MARNVKNTRMCAGCRSRKDRSELIRVYKTSEGDVSLSVSGQCRGGRGIYICREEKCLEQAVKKKSFSRSLKCELPSELYYSIEQFVKQKNME